MTCDSYAANPEEYTDKLLPTADEQFYFFELCIGQHAPFFYQIAWDVGLVVMSKDGRRVNIAFATDSD